MDFQRMDNMTPNRELNSLIAKDVFGWIEQKDKATSQGFTPWLRPDGLMVWLPDFSGDIKYAWTVLEQFHPFYVYIIGNTSTDGTKFSCSIFKRWDGNYREVKSEPLSQCEADTMPLAICAAAIKAIDAADKDPIIAVIPPTPHHTTPEQMDEVKKRFGVE